MPHTVARILERKGSDVATVAPDISLSEAVRLLTHRGVGALVVSHNDVAVLGILSERDVIHQLAERGAAVLDEPVSKHMSDALTCDPSMTIDVLSALMTEQRIRHLPVMSSGRLAGIVSIGDVVKTRLDELMETSQHLEAYVTGRY